MFYNLLLNIHIFVGFISLFTCFFVIYFFLKKRLSRHKEVFLILLSETIFQTGSGVILYIITVNDVSIVKFCSKLGIYVLLIGVSVWALYYDYKHAANIEEKTPLI
jgi:hypothetical protein